MKLQRERSPSTDSLPKWPQKLEFGQTEDRSLALHKYFHVGAETPVLGLFFAAFPVIVAGSWIESRGVMTCIGALVNAFGLTKSITILASEIFCLLVYSPDAADSPGLFTRNSR